MHELKAYSEAVTIAWRTDGHKRHKVTQMLTGTGQGQTNRHTYSDSRVSAPVEAVDGWSWGGDTGGIGTLTGSKRGPPLGLQTQRHRM
eukprot:35473-Eustigmatos_ZCMA.PRE.1